MSYQMIFGSSKILYDWWNLSEVQFKFCEISSHSDFTVRGDMPEFWYDVGILSSFSIIEVTKHQLVSRELWKDYLRA